MTGRMGGIGYKHADTQAQTHAVAEIMGRLSEDIGSAARGPKLHEDAEDGFR